MTAPLRTYENCGPMIFAGSPEVLCIINAKRHRHVVWYFERASHVLVSDHIPSYSEAVAIYLDSLCVISVDEATSIDMLSFWILTP